MSLRHILCIHYSIQLKNQLSVSHFIVREISENLCDILNKVGGSYVDIIRDADDYFPFFLQNLEIFIFGLLLNKTEFLKKVL